MSESESVPDDLISKLMFLCDESKEVDLEESGIYAELTETSREHRIISMLGEGGMKQVFLVYDEVNSRKVAMAVLKPDAPKELYEPFLREARVTSTLDHPNIITLFEMGIKDDLGPFFTMELKHGPSLSDVLRQDAQRLKSKESNRGSSHSSSLRHRLNIFLKVCDAMAYAHDRKVLHLDLKPENIQVGRFGEVRVCDWGLAKVMGRDEAEQELEDLDEVLLNPDLLNHMTMHNKLKGTPGYMAPEQIMKDRDFDERTDIYAMGCILYGILCLKPPYEGQTQTILEETKKGFFPAEKLNEKGTFVPMSLMAITRKAMSHSPSDRFAKVTDLREELERYLNGYPTEAEHAGAFRRSYLFYNRHQKVMLTILGASLMLVASLCVYIIKLSESERKAWEAMGVAEESKLEAIRSKDLAQTMQRQAEIAQQKAQQNLDRFIRELNKSRFNIMDSFMMSQPELTLRLAESRLRDLISHGPREKFTWGDRGDLNFFKNDFESAYHDYITCGEDWVQNRIEIIENEGLMTHTGPLSFSKKLSLIKALSVEKTFRSRYLALDVSKKRDLQKHGQLVEAALRSDNALWKGEFIYRPEPGYLELSGRLLKSLKSGQICTLVTLPLTELSLVRTSIDVLSLKSLNIRTLKLVGHSQQKSNGIMRLPHLSKLILKDHKIDDQTLNKMRDKGIAITEL